MRALRGWSENGNVDWHYVGGRARVVAVLDGTYPHAMWAACARLSPILATTPLSDGGTMSAVTVHIT